MVDTPPQGARGSGAMITCVFVYRGAVPCDLLVGSVWGGAGDHGSDEAGHGTPRHLPVLDKGYLSLHPPTA